MTHEPLGSASLQPHPVSGAMVPDVCSANTPSFSKGVTDPKSGLSILEWQASPRKQQLSDTLWSEVDVSTNRHQWNLLWQSSCSHTEGFSFFLKPWREAMAQLDSLYAQSVMQKSRWLFISKYIIIIHTAALLQRPKVQSYKYAFGEKRGLKVSCIRIQRTATPQRKRISSQHWCKCQFPKMIVFE